MIIASPSSSATLRVGVTHLLPAAISGESALPTSSGVLLLGGLESNGQSASGVFRLDSRTGKLRGAGTLAQPLHDAAAALIGGRIVVFGGGSSTSTDTVQALSANAGGPPPGDTATVIGHLPGARSDLSAMSTGGAAYVLGGYDGHTLDSAVLETSDGRRFHTVASLPVPVRYAATIVIGQRIYAFGGQTASGKSTNVIQVVDPAHRTARLVGHLPTPLSHAVSVAVGGRVYVVGGSSGSAPLDGIWRFDPKGATVSVAGRLPEPVANAAAATVGQTAYIVGGVGANGAALRTVISLRLERTTPAAQRPRAVASMPPFTGRLLIADRGNNRLLLVNTHKRVLWSYPSRGRPAPPGGFYFPDDAFFTHHGHAIISNEEQNETVVQIAFPSGRLLWSYGHAGVPGSSPGYLHEPDDAYLLRDHTVTVADAQNCRVLFISPGHRIERQIGSPAACVHDPPRSLGSPNGDTPLANGDVLVSEINGSWVDELTPSGRLVWSVQLPIAYPSDPQQLGPDRYLVADYHRPGGIYEFNRSGRILWSYHPSGGQAMLDHPSLAERLPNGLIAANDDYRDRVVIIDPHSKRIVWQYGRADVRGTGPDRLYIPDGFDLLAPGGTTPTHPITG